MGYGIARTYQQHLQGEHGMTEWAMRLRSSRLVRGLAFWLAFQTAFAAPLASAAELVASSAHATAAVPGTPDATGVGNVPAPSAAVTLDPNAITQPALGHRLRRSRRPR